MLCLLGPSSLNNDGFLLLNFSKILKIFFRIKQKRKKEKAVLLSFIYVFKVVLGAGTGEEQQPEGLSRPLK